jgi:hypothetical protein
VRNYNRGLTQVMTTRFETGSGLRTLPGVYSTGSERGVAELSSELKARCIPELILDGEISKMPTSPAQIASWHIHPCSRVLDLLRTS